MVRRIFLLLMLTMSIESQAGDFYSKLVEIEANNLNGNAQLKQSLEDIGQNFDQFDKQEKDFFNLLTGHSQYMHGQHAQVKETLEPVIKTTNDLNIKARATSILASSEWIIGNTVDSFIYLDQAISLLPKVKSAKYRVAILQNATGIYKESELIEYALEYARRLKVEAEKDGDNLSICAANYELSSIELMVDKLNMARSRILAAKEHCKESGVAVFQLGIEDSLARIELKEGHPDKAVKRLKSVLPFAEKIGWEMGVAIVEVNLAESLFEIEKFEEAKKYALSAFETSERLNDKKRMEMSAGILAQIYTKIDNKEKAIEYYNKYRTLNTGNTIIIRQRKLAFNIARQGKL